jgi:hypothetical protein
MADTNNPERALNVVKRVVEMCDFIEQPAIRKAIAQEIVPVTMPPVVDALVDISVWVGLGTVGLWAALDAFAERACLKGPKCPTCKSKLCISTRYACQGRVGQRLKELDELEDLRHLYAHNYAGDADDQYFHRTRHVLQRGVNTRLTCGAAFDGHRLRLDLTHLRMYSCTVRSVLERFS